MSYNATTKSFRASPGSYPGNGLFEGSHEQQAERQKAARENQAWLARKFELAHRFSSQSVGQAVTPTEPNQNAGNSSSIMKLPSWLVLGAQNQVHTEKETDFMDGGCKDIHHDILQPNHGCQVNTDTLQIFCTFQNLRIDTTRIHVDQGGERLEDVMGRGEAEEFPVYDDGAFSTRPKPAFQVPKEYRSMKQLHYMQDVLNSLQYPTSKNKGEFDSNCVETRQGTTFILTRYEYVNLYHTLTDWWNLFSVLTPEQRNRKEKFQVLFLDGHAQGNLDSVWSDVFGPFEHVKHLPSGGVCFERAVFVPPGYVATIFPDAGGDYMARVRCPNPRITDQISSFFLKAYGLEQVKPIPGKIVIIDRQPYVSHPRSQTGNFERIMTGLQNLENQLRKVTGVTSVEIIRFETLSFSEQIRTVREAQILVGNHGAGLTHLVFMDRSSHVLEFSFQYRDFFIFLAEWKGIHHVPISVSNEKILTDSEILITTDMVGSLISKGME